MWCLLLTVCLRVVPVTDRESPCGDRESPCALSADHVEITSSNQVTVCRDSVRGKCARPRCKYYHLPVLVGGRCCCSAAALGLQLL